MTTLCIILTLLFSTASILLYKRFSKEEGFVKSAVKSAIIILVFCIGMEVSLFNVNFYTSYNLKPTDYTSSIADYDEKKSCQVIPNEDVIEIDGINKEIENIYIKIPESFRRNVTAQISVTDEANEFLYSTPKKVLYPAIEKSMYINFNTIGKSERISISLTSSEKEIPVECIAINTPRPFEFNFARIAVCFAILMLLHIFKPSSAIYKRKLSGEDDLSSLLTIGFVTLQCIIFIIVGTLNPAFIGITYEDNSFKTTELIMQNHNQYDHLAQAILEDGRLYIDNGDVPDFLKKMENPYDTTARQYAQALSGERYRWDVAFFNGHYYVYFGIVPLLLFYLPFRAVFHSPFPTAIGIILVAVVFCIGVFKLLGYFCKKYFKNISTGAYILLSLATVNFGGAMFLVKRPDFYSLPIICSLAFVVWGLFFWLTGRDAEKKQNLRFLLGSLCCALAVGCRPQSILMSITALPIFLQYFFKNKYILSKKGVKNIVALALPFMVVGGGIMYYNLIRFGSPFDFGSGYNLTTNDVSKRGFDWDRTGLGIFTYLFQPPRFIARFPFIKHTDISTAYVGKTIFEYCFGGLITSTPVLWSLFCLPSAKAYLKEKRLYSLTITLLCVAIAIVVVNTQAGGLLQRYFSDFGYIFILAASLIIFSLLDNLKSAESNKTANTLLLISTILSAVYTICLVFSVADGTIDTQNPVLYGKIMHMVEFWL